MRQLPPEARVVLWTAVVAAVGVFTTLAAIFAPTAEAGLLTWRDPIHAAVALILLVTARLFPICLRYKVKTSLEGVVAFPVILLFDPFTAVLIISAGVAFHHLYKTVREKWPFYLFMFNVAQAGLAAAAGSLTFHGLQIPGPTILTSAGGLGAVVAAAGTSGLVNTLLVATMSAAAHGRVQTTLGTWRSMLRIDWMHYFATQFIGVLVAILYLRVPLALPLMLIPVVVVHRSYSLAEALQKQSRLAFEALADVIDKRDPYTFSHSQRVSQYARLAAQRLGLSQPQLDAVELAARVHDIGKIAIREDILKKPGGLSDDELEEIRKHTTIGADLVSKLADFARSRDAILYHHERWDGGGLYGLAYEHIPIGARIIAVADAFDAMTSDRPYRPALPREEALARLERGKGNQFDPVVVEAFIDAIRSMAPQPVPEEAFPRPEIRVRPAATSGVQH